MDKSKKGHSKLIISCSDPAENFKFIEETLNQMAFLIGVEIAEPRLDHITFGWDRIRCSLLRDVGANGLCSVCFITQNVASGNVHFRKQLDGDTGIKAVSAGKQKVDGISPRIHNSMDFCSLSTMTYTCLLYTSCPLSCGRAARASTARLAAPFRPALPS